MKKILRFLVFLLYSYTLSSFSQIENVKFQNLGTKDGLSYSLVTSLVEDDKGFLWISTQNGLNKYDGYEFKHYFADKTNNGLLKNHISHLYKDSHGLIWIHYFKEGIGLFDPKTNLFKTFQPNSKNEGKLLNDYLFKDDIILLIQNPFFEDKNSNIWIASENGIILYQRNSGSFKTYHYQKNNKSSLSNNFVISIEEDKYGNIWVGTKDGLNIIDLNTGKVKQIFTSDIFPELKSKPVVSKIFFQDDGSLWMGTINMGLFIIHNPFEDRIKYTQYNNQFLKDNNELAVYEIYKTLTGKTLMASSSGLYDLAYNNDIIKLNKSRRLLNKNTSYIVEDDNGYIWAAGDPKLIDNHIYRFDKRLENYRIFGGNQNTINNYGEKPVGFLQKGKNGLLYVGTIKDGVYKIDTNAKKFGLINSNTAEGAFLTNNNVYSIFEDSKNNLWIGTAQSLFRSNLKSGITRDFKNTQVGRNNISFNYSKNLESKLIGSVNETKEGKIWLGSFDYKISLYDPKKNIFLNFHNNPQDPESFTGWSVRTICISNSGDTYIGGTSMGLCKLNRNTLNFKYYTGNYDKGPSDLWINTIIEDKDDILWLGTFKGLDRFDPKTEKFKFFTIKPDSLKTSNVNVRTILEPQVKNTESLWIGTDNGLFKFDKFTGKVKFFSQKNGFPSNTILSILEDEEGFLWIGSLNGLTKFDPDNYKTINYTVEDGLQSNEFNEGAYFKNKAGMMYFGGVNGITYFNPKDIKQNLKPNQVIITNLKINQHPVEVHDTINGRVLLNKSISYVDHLELTHDDKLLSFEFSTTNKVSPADIKYRYKLEGLEDHWIEVSSNQRYANYTDLKSGKYTLLIDCTNSDGIWSNKPLRLNLYITPYIWEQFWFKFSLIILLLSIAGIYLHLRTKNLKKQKKQLEKVVKERTVDLRNANKVLEEKNLEISKMSQKIHEMDLMKLRFFTNISHEFRTPLTLILGPSEKLIRMKDFKDVEDVKENLRIIQRNSKRLHKLINQLLELRKIDSDSLKLSVSKGNIVNYSKDIIFLFRNYAKSKKIKLEFFSDEKSEMVYFDNDKVEKILYNLLSNAIKYTPKDGFIRLKISKVIQRESKQMICISVENSGKGIPPHEIENVFNRFYRVEKNNKSGKISAGIGLSLVKSLVNIYRGEIKVTSELNNKTEFKVYLPVNKDQFSSDEIKTKTEIEPLYNYAKLMLALNITNDHKEISVDKTNSNKKTKIVIVEDNSDLRKFLYNELKDMYQIFTASNGKKGLKLILNTLPNIIISDIMMPEMDGIEMCRNLKNNIQTSHIPVFLLTARNEQQHQLEGLDVGADDYITKPFNIETLKLRISNALKTRRSLILKFAWDKNPIPKDINISSLDHNLLEKIISYVENNIDTEITGNTLALELGLSKSNLYKKLKDLTGFSVNIYIRNIRLNIAAQLLKKGNYSISDIAYAVGFNNPKYFSSCFIKLYGKTPKNFMIESKTSLLVQDKKTNFSNQN